MKGLDNNEQASNTYSSLIDSLDNKIRSIYNLAYRQGYWDGIEEATHQIVDKLLLGDELREEEAKKKNKK